MQSPSLFSSIKSVLVIERSQSRVVLLHIGFFSFKFLISMLKVFLCAGLSSLPWHKIFILCISVIRLGHFLASFLYPFIFITMFSLLDSWLVSVVLFYPDYANGILCDVPSTGLNCLKLARIWHRKWSTDPHLSMIKLLKVSYVSWSYFFPHIISGLSSRRKNNR